MDQAQLIEIFTSFQGEGPYVGQEMTFVRFQHCALSCRFCDTPESFQSFAEFRFETAPHRAEFENFPNPVSPDALSNLVARHQPRVLSLTGGEPLQQSRFIKSWLASLQGRYRVLLETNGILSQALGELIDWIDVVSMDLKLPSVTGMRAYWAEHQAFLEIARRKEVYVKAIVGQDTSHDELREAIRLVRSIAPDVPFILQPVTPNAAVPESLPESQLQELFQISAAELPDVRVIPQIHPVLEIL